MFERILVATDGSPPALLAARFAGLAAADDAVVRLFHVSSLLVDLTAMSIDTASGMVGGVMGDLHQQVELSESVEGARLLEATRQVFPAKMRVETFDKRGRPAATILQALESSDCDVAVLGSRGRGSIARAFFGSVADAVVRGSAKPVVVVRRPSAHRILVGVDGSEPSHRAARAAALLARRMGGTITLAHIADVPLPERERARLSDALRSSLKPVLEGARRALAGDGLTVEEVFAFGEPAHALLDEAARRGVDLIALGRTGWSQDRRVPLGSVAQRVVTHADASVLIVP